MFIRLKMFCFPVRVLVYCLHICSQHAPNTCRLCVLVLEVPHPLQILTDMMRFLCFVFLCEYLCTAYTYVVSMLQIHAGSVCWFLKYLILCRFLLI